MAKALHLSGRGTIKVAMVTRLVTTTQITTSCRLAVHMSTREWAPLAHLEK